MAVQGVLIGAGLGLVSAYQVIVNSSTFGEANLDFVWPWAGLAIAVIVPTLAALLAAAAPAKRASMINPAVDLRTEQSTVGSVGLFGTPPTGATTGCGPATKFGFPFFAAV